MTFEEISDGSLRLKTLNAEDSLDYSCANCGKGMSATKKIRILTALSHHGPVLSSDLDNHNYTRNRQ